MVAWHGRKYRWQPWGSNENPHRREVPFDAFGAAMGDGGWRSFFDEIPGAEVLFSPPK
jgi:hypothetical protein